jgi:hypothetical protein
MVSFDTQKRGAGWDSSREEEEKEKEEEEKEVEKAKALNEVDAGRRIDKVPAIDAFVDQLDFYYNVMGTFIGMSETLEASEKALK